MRPEHWIYTIPLRLRSLFRWAQADQELDDELRDHLERITQEYVAQGMTQKEAHRRARLDLGGVEQTKEKCRDTRRVNWIQDFVQDLHYGVRTLRKSPGFTAVAVLTLALGIGANTTIFGVINATLLRPLPFPQPDRLVLVWGTSGKGHDNWSAISAPNFWDFQRQSKSFEGTAIFQSGGYNLSPIGTTREAEQVLGLRVSTGFFSVLGVRPFLGRTFLPEEETLGNNH